MLIYGIKQGNTYHYIGQTGQKLNLRFNWHKWAMRHLEKSGSSPLHVWMAKQDLDSIEIEVLKEVNSPIDAVIAEGELMKEMIKAGHPLKNIGPARPSTARGARRSKEHIQAMVEGRKKSDRNKWGEITPEHLHKQKRINKRKPSIKIGELTAEERKLHYRVALLKAWETRKSKSTMTVNK